MLRKDFRLLLLLLVLVMLSASGVVYVKYLTRIHFSDLQDLRAQRDAVDVEWNRLQIEEAALSTHARIERKARTELGMFEPRPEDVLLLEEAPYGRP